MTMRRLLFATSLVSLAVFCLLQAAWVPAAPMDWPQWRGPERNGMSTDTNLLDGWPEGGPPLAWKVSGVGGGYSSVAVTGGRIFTMGDLEDGQYVFALNQSDGRQLWKARVGQTWEDQYLGSRSTPTVDGDRVYAIGTEGDLVCLQAETGREVWRKSLPNDFGGQMMSIWKFAESPLIDGDKLIVTPGARNAALVALNKSSGAEIWRASVPDLGARGKDGAGYSSAVISEAAGVRQYVQLMGRGVVGIEAETGRYLWGYNQVANDVANIATPIVHGDYVFASTGYRTGAVLLKLSRNGDGVDAEEVYFLPGNDFQNHHGGIILRDGYLYTGTGHNRGFPLCIKMEDGQAAWGPIRNEGRGSAAVSYADGHLYMRYQNGLMILVEASPQEYREKGSFMIPEVNQYSWSHPVISGGRLYLREQNNLFAYDVSQH